MGRGTRMIEREQNLFEKLEEKKRREYEELFSNENELRKKAMDNLFVFSYKKGRVGIEKGAYIRLKPKLFGIVPDNNIFIYKQDNELIVSGFDEKGNHKKIKINKGILKGLNREKFPKNIRDYDVLKSGYDLRSDKYEGPFLNIFLRESLFVVRVPNFNFENWSVHIKDEKLLLRGIQKKDIGISRPCINLSEYAENLGRKLGQYYIKKCRENKKEGLLEIILKKKVVVDAEELTLAGD